MSLRKIALESQLALSQRCSPFFWPFLALFGKARFFRPLLRFLVNITPFELF